WYATLVRCEARSPGTTPWSIMRKYGGGTLTTRSVISEGATPASMISLSAWVAAMVCFAAHQGLKLTSFSTGPSSRSKAVSGERRGEVRRPDAAVQNRRSAQGRAQPHHRVVADRDRFGERRALLPERSGDRQRRRDDQRAGRGARSEVNVVDLGEARERAVRGDAIGRGVAIRAELQQRAPFRR